ncbi:MAG: AEC family transporter [Sneathiella sp.]
MLQTLLDPILPIFALMAIGFAVGRIGLFDGETARALNKFVFFVAQPALIFILLAKAPFQDYDGPALSLYFASEILVYGIGTWVAHKVFGREIREALLIGMTCAFVNHLYYVLPIATLIYGQSAAAPITAAIIVDLAVLFCGTIFLMDILAPGKPSPAATLIKIIKNPALMALVAGIIANIYAHYLPSGLMTYAGFASTAAAPVTLFALGVIMSETTLRPLGGIIVAVLVLKIIVHPALAYFGVSTLDISVDWKDPIILLAAGPCGAMPFVIALQYNIQTEVMTKTILISTVLTLASLAILTS